MRRTAKLRRSFEWPVDDRYDVTTQMKDQPRSRMRWPARASVASVVLRGRHLVFIDIAAVAVSYLGSFALRFDAPSPLFSEYVALYWWPLVLLLVARLIAFVVFGLYHRVWRYASIAELQSIVSAVFVSSAIAYGIVYAVGLFDPPAVAFPRSIPVIETLIATALLGGTRFSFLIFGFGRRGGGKAIGTRALIVGAGAAGVSVARQLLSDATIGLVPVGFADDQEARGHRLLGVPVLGKIDDLGTIVREQGIGTVLFALPHVDGPTLRRLVRIAERESARSLTVPSMSEVVTGQVRSVLREIQMEDLLRRAPARTDLDSIRGSFGNKDILVTGAGGSIGAELSRQLLQYGPRRLHLLGRGENSIYEVLEMLSAAKRDGIGEATELVPIIMDVRDRRAISGLIRQCAPDVVFHAAAHKHVGFMERFPQEAVATNIGGTENVLSACESAGVGRFVFVSTDKAVRPTSVMGVTKRVGELLVRQAAERSGNAYVIVRFGNVLSSRGSVVPRFRRQLAQGGPLTVTHRQARRYFMTVSEAVQLILQATILGKGGETFVLDMGAPVLIDELARDLIELHGLVPDRDIPITYTGLGVGEKLDEELFFPHERPAKTLHDSIWVATDGPTQARPGDLARMVATAIAAEGRDVIKVLAQVVPEYQPAREGESRLEPTTFEGPEG
jgi:FlaA1/EpsC-like NDP-sugar epimerase